LVKATVNREQVTKIAEENDFGFLIWLTKSQRRIALVLTRCQELPEEVQSLKLLPGPELQVAKVVPIQTNV
jgi:hypothetical protein